MNSKTINGVKFERHVRYKITRPHGTVYWTCRGLIVSGIFFTEEPNCQPDYWLAFLIKGGCIEVCKEHKIKKLLDAIDKV